MTKAQSFNLSSSLVCYYSRHTFFSGRVPAGRPQNNTTSSQPTPNAFLHSSRSPTRRSHAKRQAETLFPFFRLVAPASMAHPSKLNHFRSNQFHYLSPRDPNLIQPSPAKNEPRDAQNVFPVGTSLTDLWLSPNTRSHYK